VNSRVKQKKISLYKKQLIEAFASYTLVDIYQGEELVLYTSFCQDVSRSETVKRKRFPYYDSNNQHYLPMDQSYADAIAYFIAEGSIFSEEEEVICFVWFKEEYFGLRLLFTKQLFQVVDQGDLGLMSVDGKKLLELTRLEYEIEVLTFLAEGEIS